MAHSCAEFKPHIFHCVGPSPECVIQFDVGTEVFVSRSLVKLGALDSGRDVVKQIQNTIAFAPLLHRTYEAFEI